MGIITKIEDKLGNIIERPFKGKNVIDLPGVEIEIKRVLEGKRKNVLGRIIVPNSLSIVIDESLYGESEPFFESFRKSLFKSLKEWLKEKGYETLKKFEIEFKQEASGASPFSVHAVFKSGKFIKDSIVLLSKATGERYIINDEEMVVGRGDECDIQLDDPAVSEKHALLICRYGKLIIQDLGSKNGIRVNHEKVKKKALSHNDLISLGMIELILSVEKTGFE